MSVPRCKCTLSVSLTGDGCRYCQPQEHIERMGEWLNEERDEITALRTKNMELREALEEVSDPIRFMKERLEEDERLNGIAAVQLAEDASYLRGIATAALAAYRKGEEV